MHVVFRMQFMVLGKHHVLRLENSVPLFFSLDFSSSLCKSCLLTSLYYILLLLYVDAMIITGSDNTSIMQLKQFLNSCFEIKDVHNFH